MNDIDLEELYFSKFSNIAKDYLKTGLEIFHSRRKKPSSSPELISSEVINGILGIAIEYMFKSFVIKHEYDEVFPVEPKFSKGWDKNISKIIKNYPQFKEFMLGQPPLYLKVKDYRDKSVHNFLFGSKEENINFLPKIAIRIFKKMEELIKYKLTDDDKDFLKEIKQMKENELKNLNFRSRGAVYERRGL